MSAAYRNGPLSPANVSTTCDLEQFMAELSKPLPRHEKVYYATRRWAKKPRQAKNELRYMWQRIRRGYSNADAWSLNYHLALVTVGGVQKLREWANGYPSELTPEAWDDILGRIETGFQAWLDEDGWFTGKPEAEAKFKDGMALYAEWFGALWD